MILLKPCRHLRCSPCGFYQVIGCFAETRVRQSAFNLVPRDRLQDDPWVMRDLPQLRIRLPPHFIDGVTPRSMHIQGECRQRIELPRFPWVENYRVDA